MKQFIALFPLFRMVLTDVRVIGTAVVVFLVMSFGTFVVNYVKKPKKRRRRAVAAPNPASAKDADASESDDAGEMV